MLALKAIEAGRVTVNDNPTSQPNTFIRLDRDVITVDHEELLRKSVRPIYIVFHKPMGLIGSKEEFRRNLYSYLTNKRGWSVPIGVLPRAASGIVIVTNDRIHRAADDSSLTNLLREYQIKVHRAPKKTEITKLQKALRELWKGHESSTEVELARTTARAAWIAVRSTTGSLHDITTTLHAMGLEPLRIERTRVGPFSTEDLAAGAWYRLSAAEVDTLNAFSKEAQPASSSAAQSLWQQVKSRLFDVDAED
jgi:16S rRNA U516 pseudouridylate synthase RsuA-like enzyme